MSVRKTHSCTGERFAEMHEETLRSVMRRTYRAAADTTADMLAARAELARRNDESRKARESVHEAEARSYEITLTFVLAEPVTPDHLARRVGEACASYYALRPGEGILMPSDPSQMFLVQQPMTVQGAGTSDLMRRLADA